MELFRNQLFQDYFQWKVIWLLSDKSSFIKIKFLLVTFNIAFENDIKLRILANICPLYSLFRAIWYLLKHFDYKTIFKIRPQSHLSGELSSTLTPDFLDHAASLCGFLPFVMLELLEKALFDFEFVLSAVQEDPTQVSAPEGPNDLLFEFGADQNHHWLWDLVRVEEDYQNVH